MAVPRQITVVVPARDAEATLPDTLQGLAEQRDPPPFEVIVVDDGSRDRTGAVARGSDVVSHVVGLAGEGPAAARNAGAAVAAGIDLAFLDADCKPAPRWLSAGSAALGGADLVLGEVRPRPDQPLGPFDRSLWVTGLSPLYESANLFVRRDLFERLGGFESWLRPRRGIELGEDVWFGWRARRAGARVAACPGALAHHAVLERGALGFAAERWRLRFFPPMVKRIPELRREFLYRHIFLTERSARFDLALASLALALVIRRPAPALGALPYGQLLLSDVREPWGRQKAIARSLADAIGLVALIAGSTRHRSLLL
jgi:glycosyltransferase involved in cell wall biosynthesis